MPNGSQSVNWQELLAAGKSAVEIWHNINFYEKEVTFRTKFHVWKPHSLYNSCINITRNPGVPLSIYPVAFNRWRSQMVENDVSTVLLKGDYESKASNNIRKMCYQLFLENIYVIN